MPTSTLVSMAELASRRRADDTTATTVHDSTAFVLLVSKDDTVKPVGRSGWQTLVFLTAHLCCSIRDAIARQCLLEWVKYDPS